MEGGGSFRSLLKAYPSPNYPDGSQDHRAPPRPSRGPTRCPPVPAAARGLRVPERAHLIALSPQTPPPAPARSPPPGAPYGTLGSLALRASRHLSRAPAAPPSVPAAASKGADPHGSLQCAERTAELQACTAQVLCQPLGGLRGVYGLASHMAVGPARAPDTSALLRARPDDRSHSPPRRATCLLPLGPIVHAAATPTGSQARAPIARIRTLALPLHPAVDRLLPRRQPLRPDPPGPASLEKQLFPVLQTNCFRERTPPPPACFATARPPRAA